jgi:ABC-type glycerol-3-phosphate transport system substrate-binding protein
VRTRNLIALVLLAALVLPAFGEGQKDRMELTLLYGVDTKWPEGYKTDGYPSIETKLLAQFSAETGSVVHRKLVDLSTGSTMSMDALLAAGIPPDVYNDFAGRVAKYMVPEYALDLKPYFKDLDDFVPSVLATATRNGKVLAVPSPSWGVALAVNEDILAEAGYKIPAEWTIDEFLKAAEAVKKTGKYITVLFSKNQSSDQWWMPWFYAFGARVYASGDYSKTVINTPKSVATLRFFQTLVDNGYVPANPEALDDDIALDMWARGKVAFLAMQVGHTVAMDSAVKQGVGKAFKFGFVAFPHAKGEKPTPAAAGPTLTVVHKSADEARNKAAARLAWYLTGTEYQIVSALSQGSFPARFSAGKPMANNPLWMQLAGVIEKNGVCDFGITTQTFTAVRAQMFPLLSEMYIGKLTPEAVMNQYEANVNAILSGK